MFAASIALEFVIRQALKYGEDLDFKLVQKDFAERIARLIPGDGQFEKNLIKLSNALIDAASIVVHNQEAVEQLADAVEDGDINKARKILAKLILKSVPLKQLPKEVVALLKAVA